jgi:GTP-binding protein
MVRPFLEERGYRVFEISAVSHEGLRQLSFALADIVEQGRKEAADNEVVPVIMLRPRAVDDQGFDIRVEGGSQGNIYRVLGAKPERWVEQTDFNNEEAVGYLADRLAKLGVEDMLFKKGAVVGSTVIIGEGNGLVFDWEPTMTSAAELMTGPRGTDERLNQNTRRTNKERRDSYYDLMDAKQEAREELVRERDAGIWQVDEEIADES